MLVCGLEIENRASLRFEHLSIFVGHSECELPIQYSLSIMQAPSMAMLRIIGLVKKIGFVWSIRDEGE